MIKFPGVGAAASGVLGRAGGVAQATIGTVLQPGGGGAAGHVKQENSDLTKVVQDLLHDKLMSRMGGAEGPLAKLGGGHGPVVHGGGLGGLQQQPGPMHSAMKENGDLKKLLGDLLQDRIGGGQPAAQARPQSPLQTENDDLKKLLGDLLKSLTGGQGAQQAQPRQSALQGENEDLMKLLSDLLKGGGGAQGAGEGSGKSGGLLEHVMKQNEQMKSVLGAMQQMMQSVAQSPLAMTQQMMGQAA